MMSTDSRPDLRCRWKHVNKPVSTNPEVSSVTRTTGRFVVDFSPHELRAAAEWLLQPCSERCTTQSGLTVASQAHQVSSSDIVSVGRRHAAVVCAPSHELPSSTKYFLFGGGEGNETVPRVLTMAKSSMPSAVNVLG